MQRAEMEELRHREANNTALQAIGPRKKLKLDSDATSTTVSCHITFSLFHVFHKLDVCRHLRVEILELQLAQKLQQHHVHVSSVLTCAT